MLTRREFATGAAAAVALGGWDPPIHAAGADDERKIELRSIHTKEVVSGVFHTASGFAADMLSRLQHLLRDYRTGEEHEMDSGLYMQLSDLARAAGREASYEVISGYRSPGTNAKLRQQGHAVAEHSLHMEGRAMDVRLHGLELAALRDLAIAVKRGGVGFYPSSNFVHLDTGRVRTWEGK